VNQPRYRYGRSKPQNLSRSERQVSSRSMAKTIWIGTLNSFRKSPLRTTRSIPDYEPLLEESDAFDTEQTTGSATLANAAKLKFDVPNHPPKRPTPQRPRVLSSHFLAPPNTFSTLPKHHPPPSTITTATTNKENINPLL
jgi:hypothetical protein